MPTTGTARVGTRTYSQTRTMYGHAAFDVGLKLVQDEDIIAHLEAENAYCKDFLASLGDLQETFFQTMKGRMK